MPTGMETSAALAGYGQGITSLLVSQRWRLAKCWQDYLAAELLTPSLNNGLSDPVSATMSNGHPGTNRTL